MRKRILVTVLATVLGASAAHAGLINGGFDTGDLTGWTTFTTPNGSLGGEALGVVAFDTDADGVADPAATFRVGTRIAAYPDREGGGIRQDVTLGAGGLTLSAEIAAWSPEWGNFDGGLFSLLFDGVVVASHDFGPIAIGASERATLSASLDVAAGVHEVALLMTRPWREDYRTPLQFVDDVTARGTAVEVATSGEPPVPVQAPEPGTLSLVGLGLLGLARARRRRTRSR